jgi:hypothetical protein
MIEREIPDLKMSICLPLFKFKEERTDENYLKNIEKFERDCEESFIKTLSKIGTQGMVKTDPYSLPYTDEVVVSLYGESYMNGPYEFYRVARKFLKEVLDKDLYKVRFYIKIDIVTERGPEKTFFLGKIVYKFRYYNQYNK